MNSSTEKSPALSSQPPSFLPLWLAIFPISVLFFALSFNVFIFGNDALDGSSQLIIVLVTGLTSAIGMYRGVAWQTQQKAIVATIDSAMPSILILLLVGSLASIWLLSGTVPLLVYYGVKLLTPTTFLVAACIACAVTSIVGGSSWSTAATVGLAMVGVGRALGIPDGLIGGAIISGSYFGDKVSPLSDTTNLAAAVTETPLFDHIRYLFYTTGPSIIITVIAFTIIGFTIETTATSAEISGVTDAIAKYFNLTPWLLLPPIIVLGLIISKVDAVPSLFIGVLSGAFCALVFQQDLLTNMAHTLGDFGAYQLLITTLANGVDIQTQNSTLNSLLSTSGMAGMLGTVWLILAAMTFGGVMEASGMLPRIMLSIKSVATNFFRLVACTAGTCIITNVSASDQAISVAVPGRMYAGLYKDMGYSSCNLSRTLEDTGTVTSVLIPWNTCGAYHATVLGIGTLTYLPYCFFNLLSPVMTLLLAWLKFRIARTTPATDGQKQQLHILLQRTT